GKEAEAPCVPGGLAHYPPVMRRGIGEEGNIGSFRGWGVQPLTAKYAKYAKGIVRRNPSWVRGR
ncbi:MAG: hypothetical protein ACREL6_00655, partial [Gemmatimonadales bacterium]